MSICFVLAFGAAVILDSLFVTDAHQFRYISVHKEGINVPDTPMASVKLVIPRKQCSGELKYPDDYNCYNAYVPQLLQVEVQDDEGPPKVIISPDQKKVEIYRVACDSPALIITTITCAPM